MLSADQSPRSPEPCPSQGRNGSEGTGDCRKHVSCASSLPGSSAYYVCRADIRCSQLSLGALRELNHLLCAMRSAWKPLPEIGLEKSCLLFGSGSPRSPGSQVLQLPSTTGWWWTSSSAFSSPLPTKQHIRAIWSRLLHHAQRSRAKTPPEGAVHEPSPSPFSFLPAFLHLSGTSAFPPFPGHCQICAQYSSYSWKTPPSTEQHFLLPCLRQPDPLHLYAVLSLTHLLPQHPIHHMAHQLAPSLLFPWSSNLSFCFG